MGALSVNPFISPDHPPLPSNLNQATEPDRHKLLPDRVEKLRVHGLVAPAFFAADLRPRSIETLPITSHNSFGL